MQELGAVATAARNLPREAVAVFEAYEGALKPGIVRGQASSDLFVR